MSQTEYDQIGSGQFTAYCPNCGTAYSNDDEDRVIREAKDHKSDHPYHPVTVENEAGYTVYGPGR